MSWPACFTAAPKRLHLVQTVSTTVEVEADTVEEALEKVYDNNDKPVWEERSA